MIMKRRKVTVAVLSVVLAAAALTGCGSAQQTNGPKKTRVVLNEVVHSIFMHRCMWQSKKDILKMPGSIWSW